MSYQNVGTPRFYVDVFSYLNAIGLVDVIGSNSLGENLNVGLNPTNSNSYTMSENSNFFRTQFKEKIPLSFFQNKDNKTAYALLGHNCSSSNVNWNVKIRSNTTNSSEEDYGDEGYNEIINKGRGGSQYNEPDFDGFSIYEVEHGITNNELAEMQLRVQVPDTSRPTLEIGSLFMGTYFDMPNSPDLSLKLSFEYDGVKTIQTRGGATLSNATYIKPADWGSYGAWQLGSDVDGNPVDNLRSGRRVWDLSFSYISDSDLMPKVAATTNLGSGDNEYINPDTNTAYENSLLQGNDFFSQVWNRTLGGHLPFIFQANNSNNSPDQFSICRFDMNTLQYDQVANNVYNVKLKIREVW
mgnify:CR=1 FL=1